MRRTLCSLLLLGLCNAQIDIGDFIKNLRPLSGGSLLNSVEKACSVPLKELGKCLTDKESPPKNRLGQTFVKKAGDLLANIRSHPEVVELESIGAKVEKCFADQQCVISPLPAVRCLLDYIIYGGPYARAAECIQRSWGTTNKIQTPEFGDLSAIENEVKLFAGMGLYKRLNANRDKFWEANLAKMAVYCEKEKVPRLQSCIDDAAWAGKSNKQPLRLNLAQMSEDTKAAKCRQRGGTNCASGSNNFPLPLPNVELSVFGEREDLEVVKNIVLWQIIGCGIDLVVHPANLPKSTASRPPTRASANPIAGILAMFRDKDVCRMPRCIQYLWTIKDSLCDTCRTSIFPDVDPFEAGSGFTRFASAASKEFVSVVSDQSRDYRCRLKGSMCADCQRAGRYWTSARIDPLAGYEAEAKVVLSLLKTVCNLGAGAEKITADKCPDYAKE